MRILNKKYIRIIRIGIKENPHDFKYRIMRTDYFKPLRRNGEETTFDKNGKVETKYAVQTINPSTLSYMKVQNFTETECEDIFQEFDQFFYNGENVIPRESSMLQDDAYYIRPEHMPDFLKHLKSNKHISLFNYISKDIGFELNWNSEMAITYNTLAEMLSIAQDLMQAEVHTNKMSLDNIELNDPNFTIPYVPHEHLMGLGTGSDLATLIHEYIEDNYALTKKHDMNEGEYTLFVKGIAEYVINFIKPLNPSKKEDYYNKELERLRGIKPNRIQQFYFTLIHEIENEIKMT